MKRLATFLFAAGLACGMAAPASAIDVNVSGGWDFSFGYSTNSGFKDSIHGFSSDSNDNRFFARQRVRTQLEFIASETLSGLLLFEMGVWDWGMNGEGSSAGAQLDTDGVNVATKSAYLNWVIPGTKVSTRMGLQPITQPSTPMGATVFDMDVAGIIISSPVAGPVSATAFWARPFDTYPTGSNTNLSDEMDVFGLLLPVEGDGWSVTPWSVYSYIGAGSGYYDYHYFGRYENTVTARDSRAKAYWLGLHTEFSPVDSLTLNLEGIYGRLNRASVNGLLLDEDTGDTFDGNFSASGWFLAMTVDYSLDWGTPGIFGWYASGDRGNSDHTGRSGRMPLLGVDGGSFGPTTFGTAGTFGIGNDGAVTGTGLGSWGVGVQLADLTFAENLSHTLRLAYYRGTNDADLIRKGGEPFGYDADAIYLTDKDWVFEVNFDHAYQFNDNLSFVLEMGYLHLKADKDVWRGWNTGRNKRDNAYKAELNMLFEF